MMDLHSAAALVRDGAVLWQRCCAARLHVAALSDAFIEGYLDAEWPAVAGCVGVFRIEARGVQLFEAIERRPFHHSGHAAAQGAGALRKLGELAAMSGLATLMPK